MLQIVDENFLRLIRLRTSVFRTIAYGAGQARGSLSDGVDG
jgi:hypothetical protein